MASLAPLLVLVSALHSGASDLALFKNTYEESRDAFRAVSSELAHRFDRVEAGALTVPSVSDRDLTIDYAYEPAQGEPRSLV